MESYILFGEENKESIIHALFCEYNFMEKLMSFSKSKNKEINMQIIKTLSKLITNIKNKVLFYYIMSNNDINNIISKN